MDEYELRYDAHKDQIRWIFNKTFSIYGIKLNSSTLNPDGPSSAT